MKTRCPNCHTVYDVDPKVLEGADGLARCYHCGTVFDAFEQRLETAEPEPPESAPEPPPEPEPPAGPSSARPLPFELPEDLEEIEPADEVALDAEDALAPPRPRRTPFWQKLLLVLLVLALAAQLAWIRRDLWIHLPQAAQLCAVLDCELREQARPQDFHVLERDLKPIPGDPPALRLWLVIRNDAPFPQPLPRLQLILQDAGGALVARRLFNPTDYLPPDWSGPAAALPGEVITIDLRLKDPGPRARGFVIDFL